MPGASSGPRVRFDRKHARPGVQRRNRREAGRRPGVAGPEGYPERVTFGSGGDSEFQSSGSDADTGGEDDLLPEPEYHTALPPKLEAWRKRSAAGAILTGFALGLQEALETKRKDPAIVLQTSGDPPRDLPVEAEFEYGRPRQTVVSIRPWLLDGAGAEQDADDAGPSAPGAGSSGGDGAAGPHER
jgi:hypothetical protein